MPPSNEVAQQDQRTPMQKLIDTVGGDTFKREVALALPEGTPPARFARIAITALLEQPDIADADPGSVYTALLKAAGDGLLPDGREAALVLRKPKGGGKRRAGYMPMIGGFRKIAAEHGWSLRTTAVYEADSFAYELGIRPTVQHSPAPLGVDRGKIVAAYGVAEHRDGYIEVEVMTAEDIDKVRKKAETQAVWNEWPDRMTEKTVGRRLFKRLPLGPMDPVAADRVKRVLDADALEPDEAERLVYGEIPPRSPIAAAQVPPADTEHPVGEPGKAPSAGEGPSGPPPLPFTGDEPGAETWALTRAAKYVLGEAFTVHAGRTIAEVLAEDREYVEWLASDAIEDEEVREIAREALDA